MKRILDIVGAAIGLLILFPVMFFVSLWIRYKMGSPVLFRQTRSGPARQTF